MKKSIFIPAISLFIIILLSSCTSDNKKIQQQAQQTPPLKEFLDSFIAQNENLMNNNVTMNDGANALMTQLQESIGDTLPFVINLPLQFEMLLEYPKSPFEFESDAFKNTGKYVAKFSFGSNCNYKISDDYTTTFQIFTIIDKELALQLIENKLYHINGIFKDFANTNGSFVLPSGKCFEGFPKINSIDSKPYIDLGTLIIEDISFKQV